MNRIRELRKSKGVKLKEVAEAVNIAPSQLSFYETGKRQPRDKETWQKLANYFGVSVAYLMGLTDDSLVKFFIVPEDEIEKEIEKGTEAFNADFIDFLKYHDLHLTDNQINIAINMLFSMSNINNDFLNYLFSKNDLERIEIEKNRNYKNLFSYSSLWSINYETLVFKKQKEEKS